MMFAALAIILAAALVLSVAAVELTDRYVEQHFHE